MSLYHLAIASEWRDAIAGGVYERSTVGLSLAEVGFIHLSLEHQVAGVAAAFYEGRDDVVLLRIDPAAPGVAGNVRMEDVPGADEQFPHLYGPLPIEAVVEVRNTW